MAIDETRAREIIELTKPAIETLHRILFEVKLGAITRAIYDELRKQIVATLGKIFSLQHDLHRAFPNLNNLSNSTFNPSGKSADDLFAELFTDTVIAPANGMTRDYAEMIQQSVLKAIQQIHCILDSQAVGDHNIELHIGHIIGRMQGILEIVIAIFPDLDDLKDVEIPREG